MFPKKGVLCKFISIYKTCWMRFSTCPGRSPVIELDPFNPGELIGVYPETFSDEVDAELRKPVDKLEERC